DVCSSDLRLVQIDDDGSVVGGAFALAFLTVDARPGDPCGQGGGVELEVDAHALALGKAQPRVVPVRVDSGARRVLAGDLPEARAVEGEERLSLGRGDVGLAVEDLHVPHVLVLRRHVEVPGQGDLCARVGVELGGRVLAETGQPVELVRVVRVGQLAAVGDVEAVHAD